MTAGNGSVGDEHLLFDVLLAEVMAQASGFGHRQHVQLTWLAVPVA
jgi:hypothetical protein